MPRKFNGKIIFSTNGAEIFEYPYAKEWMWTPSLAHTQKLSHNERLKVRANTIKLLKNESKSSRSGVR